MCSTDGPRCGLGEAEVQDLALGDQLAVSMCVTPSSRARWMVRMDSASSTAPSVVYVPAMVTAPRPMRDTPRAPRWAFCMRGVVLRSWRAEESEGARGRVTARKSRGRGGAEWSNSVGSRSGVEGPRDRATFRSPVGNYWTAARSGRIGCRGDLLVGVAPAPNIMAPTHISLTETPVRPSRRGLHGKLLPPPSGEIHPRGWRCGPVRWQRWISCRCVGG